MRPRDDQVLEATGDEQLAAVQEAEVSRAQVRRPVRRPGQTGLEVAPGLLRAVPVPGRHAPARHPDLSDAASRARDAGVGIGDQDLLLQPGAAAAHQSADRSLSGDGDFVPFGRRGRPAAGPARPSRSPAAGPWPATPALPGPDPPLVVRSPARRSWSGRLAERHPVRSPTGVRRRGAAVAGRREPPRS